MLRNMCEFESQVRRSDKRWVAKGASSDEEENWENIVHRRCAAVGSGDRNSVIAVGLLAESKLHGGLRIRGGKRIL